MSKVEYSVRERVCWLSKVNMNSQHLYGYSYLARYTTIPFHVNGRHEKADIDKQEFNLVPLDLQTFIDFYVFLLGIRFYTDFTLLRQP